VEPDDKEGADTRTLIPALRALAEELNVAVHDITARWVDGMYHVEAHVTVDGRLPLAEAHAVASQLEELAEARIDRLAQLVTHIEPADEAREQLHTLCMSADYVTETIRDLVAGLDISGVCHDIQVYPVGGNWAASLHYVLDEDLPVNEAHTISVRIERRLRDAIPRLDRVVVHTEPLTTPEEL